MASCEVGHAVEWCAWCGARSRHDVCPGSGASAPLHEAGLGLALERELGVSHRVELVHHHGTGLRVSSHASSRLSPANCSSASCKLGRTQSFESNRWTKLIKNGPRKILNREALPFDGQRKAGRKRTKLGGARSPHARQIVGKRAARPHRGPGSAEPALNQRSSHLAISRDHRQPRPLPRADARRLVRVRVRVRLGIRDGFGLELGLGLG